MNARLPRFLASGLFILMGGLFFAAFLLIRSHYAASLSSVESSFGTILAQQTEILQEQIAQQEAERFSLHKTEQELETDLFIVLPDSVVPACTAGLLDFISGAEADEALAQGIAALPEPTALPFFETAAKRRVKTPTDLYKKVAAHFNMLELQRKEPVSSTTPHSSHPEGVARASLHAEGAPPSTFAKASADKSGGTHYTLDGKPDNDSSEVQTVCRIITLLDSSEISLTASQTRFFNTLLAEQVSASTGSGQAEFEKTRTRSSKLWKTAKAIDQSLTRQKGAYRAVIDGQTLSVRKDGLALLYSPKIQTIPSVQLSRTQPTGLSEEIIPGWFAAIPDSAFEEAKQRIRHQYKTGNGILALMLLLSCALAGGMLISARRQHELNAMKTNFIATVSHELRTPLSLIRLHAETLHHGRVPEGKVHDYHQTILTESERLTGIVNNVLDFSRMERNKLQMHIEPTDLSALSKRIADSFRFRLEPDGFELEQQIQPGIVAPADPLAFSQILFNLMDNALKYSDGEKSIRIEMEHSGGHVILRVADRGIGIPDKLKKHIFDDFVRSDDSRVTARRGSGIGLSVARRLAEEMGASIDVMDNKPAGTIFTVRFKASDETIGG